jgi:hypothetical protein
VKSDERDSIAEQFGVSTEQVERDHLISHVLAFLSTNVGDQVQFIGGTALARTHLPAGRLSEDIDLIAIDERKPVAAALDEALPRALSRSHGRLTIDPPLGSVASTHPASYSPDGGWIVGPNSAALLAGPYRLAVRTSRARSALRRRPCGRVAGPHLAGLRRVENLDVG